MVRTVSSRVAPRSLRAQLDAINQDQETLESSNSVQACASFSADIDARQALLRNRLIPRMRLSRTSIPRLLPSYVCATAKSSASQEKRRQSFDQGVSENHTAKHDIRVADVVSFGDRARLYEQSKFASFMLHISARLTVDTKDLERQSHCSDTFFMSLISDFESTVLIFPSASVRFLQLNRYLLWSD